MISTIFFLWIFGELHAPTWLFVLTWIRLWFQILEILVRSWARG